jgi:single-strand DNA-binding protein
MFCKKVRLGKDAEIGTTKNGKTMMKLNAAYDIGFGQDKRTQWISLVKFGDSAAKLAPYLTKGKEVVIYADDIECREHNGKAYMNGVIVNFDFVSGQYNNQQSAPAPHQQQFSINQEIK